MSNSKMMPAEYWIWRAMIKRCLKPKQVDFKTANLYEKITVCDQWQVSFKQFMDDEPIGHLRNQRTCHN